MTTWIWVFIALLISIAVALLITITLFRVSGEQSHHDPDAGPDAGPECESHTHSRDVDEPPPGKESPRAILRRGGIGTDDTSEHAELRSVFSASVFTHLSQEGFEFEVGSASARSGAKCPPNSVKVSDMAIMGVTRSGVMAPINLDLCFKGVTTCFGQNPASPYTGPRWLNRPSIDWVMAGNGTSSAIEEVVSENVLGTFTLGDDQAVVVYGLTPPQCIYYALTPYVYMTPACGSTVLFASAADSTNNNDLRGPDGRPFDQPFAVIYSSNLTLGQAVRDALLASSSNDPRAHCRPDPSRVIFVPIKRQAPGTTYVVVGRAAGFASDKLRDQYLDNTRMRISLLTGSSHFKNGPFQTVSVWKPRATQGDENVDPGDVALKAAVARVTLALSATDRIRGWTSVPTELFLSNIGYDNGDDCLRACTECRGDNRDTVYRLANFGQVGPNDVLLVMGANHNRTGKSTYTNFTVYDADLELGLDSVDVFNKEQQWNLSVISRRPIDLGGNVRDMNPHVVILPEGVTRVYVAERAYLQTLGEPNISAAPDTLLPFIALRGAFVEGGECHDTNAAVQVTDASANASQPSAAVSTNESLIESSSDPVYATPLGVSRL